MRTLACAALVGLLGCGESGRPRGPGSASTWLGEDAGGAASSPPEGTGKDVAFACDETPRGEPAQLRRLTMTQYRNTVSDLTRWALGDARAAESALTRADLDAVPLDRREPAPDATGSGYRRLDQALDQRHVDETYRVGVSLGRSLTTPENLNAVVGPCATDRDPQNDDACLSAFIHRFGARALRRPLDESDEAFYRVVYGERPTADPAGYADVLAVMLSAPELLYFVEHGESEVPGQPGSFLLSAHELASRLSYHFWQTLPDDSLWQAAEDGTLLQPDELSRQVARLMADSRTRQTMSELFSDWLALDGIPRLDAHVADPAYTAFAGADLPGPGLRQQVIDDALGMLAHYTWTEPAGLDALLTSERSFARGPALARIYGVDAWNGSSEPPSLPEGERPGILTRAWLLATSSTTTRPILRGAFLRRNLLCDELGDPPVNASVLSNATQTGHSTRDSIEQLTEQPGSACAGCHATLINPLGFALEGYDALGRVRDTQRVFGTDGMLLGHAPLDTTSIPRVTPDDERPVDGPEALVERMRSSGKLEACLVRNYFRFTFGRPEDLPRDGCVLEQLRTRLAESGRIRDLLEEAAWLPELRQRRFVP